MAKERKQRNQEGMKEFDHRKGDCPFRQGSAGLSKRVTWANAVELWGSRQ